MSWLPVLATATALIAISSVQTTPQSPASNLAALESAEKILGTIDDLAIIANPVTPFSIPTTEIVRNSVSITSPKPTHSGSQPLDDGRRSGNALPLLEAIYKNGTRGLGLTAPLMEYLQSLYSNNAIPPMVPGLAQNPTAGQGVPSEYSKQSQDIRQPDFLEANGTMEDRMPVFHHAPTAQPLIDYYKRPELERHQNPPVHNIPSPLREWIERALTQIHQQVRRKPMKSSAPEPLLPGKFFYSRYASLPSVENTIANAKVITLDWQQPKSPFPASYTTSPPAQPRPPPPRRPSLTASPLSVAIQPPVRPQMLKNTQRPENARPPVNIRPHLKVRSPPIARLNANPRPATNVQPAANVRPSPNIRPTANVRPLVTGRPYVKARPTAQPLMPPRLPEVTPNALKKMSTKKKPTERLLKLMKFMKDNRETLLQFIALKRNHLLKKGVGGDAVAPRLLENAFNGVMSFKARAPGVAALVRSTEGRGNAVGDGKDKRPDAMGGKRDMNRPESQPVARALPAGYPAHKLDATGGKRDMNRPESQPVVRALPAGYPAQMLDLSPGKGVRITHMRDKNRICQRNVMVVAGPKYDSEARVRKREFKPGVDGAAFRVTKRKLLLLPACCNCCRKSVLGCE